MTKTIGAGALALSLLCSAAWAVPADPQVSIFAQGAALSNAFEIETSKVILQDSKDPATRAFAQRMIDDHVKAEAALDRAAAQAGVASRYAFDADRQKIIDDIGLMDSPKLDTTYLSEQQQAHARAAASLSDYAAHGSDPALQAYARATLPTVLEHQRMLRNLTDEPNPV